MLLLFLPMRCSISTYFLLTSALVFWFQFDPGNEQDSARLKKLFLVAQTIMTIKDVAAEIAEEQFKEHAVGEGRLTAKKGWT